MSRCEDFPCCGHELGCCPDYYNGRQVNMICTCGQVLPINNRFSICDECLHDNESCEDERDRESGDDDYEPYVSPGWVGSDGYHDNEDL